jgi:hypothetical protein
VFSRAFNTFLRTPPLPWSIGSFSSFFATAPAFARLTATPFISGSFKAAICFVHAHGAVIISFAVNGFYHFCRREISRFLFIRNFQAMAFIKKQNDWHKKLTRGTGQLQTQKNNHYSAALRSVTQVIQTSFNYFNHPA